MTEPSASSNSPFLPGEQPPAPEPAGEVAVPEPSSGEHAAAEPPAEAAAALAADAGAAPSWQPAPESMVSPESIVPPEPVVDSDRFPLPLMSAPADSEAGAPVDPADLGGV